MSEELKVTQPGAIKRATRLIRLPAPQNGVEIVLEVGALEKSVILEQLGGIPGASGGAGATRTFDDLVAAAKGSVEVEKKIAALGILAPAFSFDAPEDGKAYWRDLTMGNQAFVVAEILDLSDWGKEGPTKKDKSFPAGAAGDGAARGGDVRDGGGVGGAVPDAGAAAA